MLVFPQLSTGAIAQAPFSRTYSAPSLVNALDDGSDIRGAIDGESSLVWDLSLKGLSDPEISAIEDLFGAACGRAGTFLFLDPAGNLLEWSEDLSRSSWRKGAMLELQAGIADPLGGSRAARMTNAGQSAQELAQGLAAPARFQYCLSVYARAATACSAVLTIRCSEGGRAVEHAVNSKWRRIAVIGAPGVDAETVEFAIGVPSGASVELFGIQAEARPNASAYARTGSRGGVYPAARFDHDTLRIQTEGPNNHGARIRIVSPAGE